MGSYSLDEVIKRWELGKLTTDQMIGQIILLMQHLSDRVGTLEKVVEKERNGRHKSAH